MCHASARAEPSIPLSLELTTRFEEELRAKPQSAAELGSRYWPVPATCETKVATSSACCPLSTPLGMRPATPLLMALRTRGLIVLGAGALALGGASRSSRFGPTTPSV